MNYAPSTIQHFITMISGIYQFAIQNKLINIKNPCEDLKAIKFNNKRDRYLSTEEVKQLKEAVSNELELLLFVEIALNTGARLGSIMEMTKSDIDFHNESIKINNFKTNDKYTGYLNHTAINGCSIYTIKELMNHKSIEITERYAKLAPNHGQVQVKGLYK